MNAGTLQALELIGWVVLMYWLLTMTRSPRDTADESREQGGERNGKSSTEDR